MFFIADMRGPQSYFVSIIFRLVFHGHKPILHMCKCTHIQVYTAGLLQISLYDIPHFLRALMKWLCRSAGRIKETPLVRNICFLSRRGCQYSPPGDPVCREPLCLGVDCCSVFAYVLSTPAALLFLSTVLHPQPLSTPNSLTPGQRCSRISNTYETSK